jgi:hypothetical protein
MYHKSIPKPRVENRTDYFRPTDRPKAYETQKQIRSDSCQIRSWIRQKDMVLLISDRIRRYTIFHGYIRTIFDKISGNELLSMWPGREDKRELYILYYGTQTPPCKAQASFIWIYIYIRRKIYKLILLYYQWEIQQNVYPEPNHIRSIFGPYSLPIDSDSVFVSAHYALRFQIQKNMVTNTVSLLSVGIRSVFTPTQSYV